MTDQDPELQALIDAPTDWQQIATDAAWHVEYLEAAIQRVRDLHSRVDVWNECAVCTEHAEALPYPCPTIQALGGSQ